MRQLYELSTVVPSTPREAPVTITSNWSLPMAWRLCGTMPYQVINTLRPRQNGWPPFRRRHFQTHFFLYENVWISIEIPLNFVPKAPINNIPVLVKIMAWRRPGDEQFSEPMMVRLPTHICVSRPQWVNIPKRGRRQACRSSFLGEVTKATLINPPIRLIFDFVKVLARFVKSHSYSTCVSSAVGLVTTTLDFCRVKIALV